MKRTPMGTMANTAGMAMAANAILALGLERKRRQRFDGRQRERLGIITNDHCLRACVCFAETRTGSRFKRLMSLQNFIVLQHLHEALSCDLSCGVGY